jgi:IS605 OrfB family transposase
LAVSVAQSSVKFYKGNKIKWKNEFFRKQKTLLQRNFAIQKIKKLKGRQTRYNNFQINNIAKQIIIQAKKEIKPVIIMEDLKNILMTTKTNKKQRIQLHNWVFRKIQYAIHYKANWEGIPVMYINPYHTSQICSKCGELNKRNKHIYKCKNCGFECNADYNAGRNLQKIFLARCQKEQVLINNTSNCNIPEFKFLKDIRVRNSQINGGEILC